VCPAFAGLSDITFHSRRASREGTTAGGCINTPTELKLNSMDDVAALMRENLPKGMTPKQLGEVMQWGRGSASALRRIPTLTVEDLRAAGITVEMANNWAAAYDAVVRLTPKNPSAAGRAALMRHAARLLGGG
jgi:uncharacterized protein